MEHINTNIEIKNIPIDKNSIITEGIYFNYGIDEFHLKYNPDNTNLFDIKILNFLDTEGLTIDIIIGYLEILGDLIDTKKHIEISYKNRINVHLFIDTYCKFYSAGFDGIRPGNENEYRPRNDMYGKLKRMIIERKANST